MSWLRKLFNKIKGLFVRKKAVILDKYDPFYNPEYIDKELL